MKNPHDIILQPHITERSVAMSYGDARIREEKELVRKYTFLVATSANKLEIKAAIEAIYGGGKKGGITVDNVHTVRIPGKSRRVGQRVGVRPDRKKAIITLAKGQILEDYGV